MSKDSSSNNLSITSFADLLGQRGIDVARLVYQDGETPNLLSTVEIHRMRAFLPTLLAYYKSELEKTNSAYFAFLSEGQKAALRHKLLFTYLLLYAQHQLDSAEKRRYTLAAHRNAMRQCNQLIDQLDNAHANETPESLLEAECQESDKPFKFCGLTIFAPYFVKKIMEFISDRAEQFSLGKTVVTKQIMTDINGVRLYWVWTGSMLALSLDALPDNFFHKQQAQQGVSAPSPITGYMSWILYYARFGINLMLLLKHTIKGPWMSIEEAKIPVRERFITQWNQRKFALLNDSIWATANMVCFFWLRGNGMLGYTGNIVTAALLLMDFSFTAWRFWEETTAHNAYMLELDNARAQLNIDIEQEINPENLIALRQQLDDLNKAARKAEFDWKYKRYNTINDLVYAGSLLIAFSLMCCFFCPVTLIAPATLLIVGLAGATLCFMLTLAYTAVTGGLEIAKSRASAKQNRQECAELLLLFNETADENTQKQLYLQMKNLMAQSDYQERMARFQALKLVRSIFIDVLVPVLIFSALVFMPLGIGIGVLAGGLALAVLSKILLNQFEPEPEKLPPFDNSTENAFKLFKADPARSLRHFAEKPPAAGFFIPAQVVDEFGASSPGTTTATSDNAGNGWETPLIV